MKKRLLSLVLCLALVVSLLPALGLTAPVKAAATNQSNIVDRANYLYDITWLCQTTVDGWCSEYTYDARYVYHLPYGQPINSGAYIGYGVSIDDFILAARDPSSAFYTSRSTYSTTDSVYYATDSSAFVSWCWGIDRKTTYYIPQTENVSYIAAATAANASLLQLGDCLNSSSVGHVVLVTGLTYNSSGNVTQIEITEQTVPEMQRTYYTPAELESRFGANFGIYRYGGTVPAAPAPAITTQYYPACDSSYVSLYAALDSIGVICDWTLHSRIAELNGITGFIGSAAQNTQLLNLLKEGKLLNPDYCDAEDYLEMCTVYPSHCKVTTTASAPLNTLPCSPSTSSDSQTLVTAEAGKTYIAKALYLNTSSNYWYQITLTTGETAYVYSGNVKMVESIGTDITVSDAATPGTLTKGAGFKLSGKVASTYSRLDKVEVGIYTGSNVQGTQIASTSVAASNNTCNLSAGSLDFTALAAGSYYYNITAKYSGYYATSPKVAATYSGQVSVIDSKFTVSGCSQHSFTTKVIQAATCTTAGVLERTCTVCGFVERSNIVAFGHSYSGGKCTVCGATGSADGTSNTYYLIGFINGADYGCETDWENLGTYKFVNGKLTATFNQDSYVFLKTGDNASWYMTQSYCTGNTATLYNTDTGANEKLFVPGNVQITFTLTKNTDGSLTLSYVTGAAVESSVVPTLTLKSPTLEFKDMICINAFYTAENIQDVVEMGMITYSSNVTTLNVATAEHVIPGYTYDASIGRYYSSSQGIHAKYLGDTVYLAIYAKLKDGNYAYSKLAPYSAVTYATSQLKNSTDTKLKQLVVAMLNYGAEAQLYFGHNTGFLANASLTAAQKALPEVYRADMIKAVSTPSALKQGSFANNSGFAKRIPAISFEGAFCINYFFTPKYVPNNGITLYYWNASSYNRAGVLTTANATGSLKLEGSGIGEYRGDITGIAAKGLSDAVYVAAVYENGGTTWTSGVLGYSIGAYCSSQASKGAAISGLAKATAVYGYHAKQYFG